MQRHRPQPHKATRQQMVKSLRTYIARNGVSLSKISCAQEMLPKVSMAKGSSHASGDIMVDLQFPDLTKPTGLSTSINVGRMIQDLFDSNHQFSFMAMAFAMNRLVAVFRWLPVASDDVRRATIYADPDTGEVLRIAFRGFAAPAHFASFYCWANS
jgi:hypothetical protein